MKFSDEREKIVTTVRSEKAQIGNSVNQFKVSRVFKFRFPYQLKGLKKRSMARVQIIINSARFK
jgi:hypothetical protein